MRPPPLIRALSIIQLHVEKLVHALEGAANADLVLELHRNFVVN